jgi:hypothetical protein
MKLTPHSRSIAAFEAEQKPREFTMGVKGGSYDKRVRDYLRRWWAGEMARELVLPDDGSNDTGPPRVTTRVR